MTSPAASRRRWPLPLGALALLDALLFADLLTGPAGRVPMGHDVETHGRLLDFVASHVARGELPRWNPHVFGGMPALGDPNAMMLYPPTLLATLFPLPRAIVLLTIAHVLLLGVSVYAWMARRGLHPVACLLAAAMTSLGAPFFARIYAGHLTALAAMAWAPAFLLAIDALVDEPSCRWVAIGAISLAMQLLGGHPQFVLYTLAVGAGLAAWGVVSGRTRARGVLTLVLVLALGFGLAAAQLVAVVAATRESTRGGDVSYAFLAQHSMSWSGALTLLAPGFFGQLWDRPHWGPWYYWEVTPYVGVIGLALAIQGALYGGRGRRRLAAIGVVVFVVLALGDSTPLLRILYELGPPFDALRGPGRALFTFSLFAAMLAAVGLDGLIRKRPASRALIASLACTAVVLALFAVWIRGASRGDAARVGADVEAVLSATSELRTAEIERVARGDQAWGDRLQQLGTAADAVASASDLEGEVAARREYEAALVAATTVDRWQALRAWIVDTETLEVPIERWADPVAAEKQATDAASSAGAAAAGCAVAALFLGWSRRSGRAATALVVVAVLELALFAHAARGTFDFSRAALEPLEAFYRARVGEHRVHNPALPNSAMSLDALDIWGTSPLVSARYASYMAFTQGSSATDARAPFLSLWRVHPSHRMLRLTHVVEQDGNSVRVLAERTDPLPSVLLVSDYVVRDRPTEIFAILDSPSWNPAKTVVLEAEPHPAPATGGDGGRVRVLRQTTDRMTIEADVPAPTILLVTDAYSSAWRARSLAGSAQRAYDVVPANYVLRAVPLSAGHHALELWYEPRHLRAGVVGSAVALLGVVVLALGAIGRRRAGRSAAAR